MNRDTSLHRKRRRAFAFLITLLNLLVFVSRYAPAQAPGDIDTLDLNILGKVYATAVQPDGKIIIAGGLSSVLGFSRQNIARLNANGTLDLSFFPKANLEIECVAVQTDGKVLLAGGFTAVQPSGQTGFVPRNHIARLYADGSLDMGFDPNVDGPLRCLAVQADGKVLLGGAFGTVFSIARQCIARVNPDGTLDSGFDPKANFNVYSVAVQADGKVLLGGLFTALQPNGAPFPTTRNGIARVNANGTLDTGFDPNSNSSISSIAVQADGKVLLGGFFTTLQPNDALTPTTRNRIARVNADATLDTGFDPNANDGVASVALQADGKIILGGSFTTLQPNGAVMPTERRGVARVNADGTLDSAFDPKANDQVFGVAIQADGRVLLNGNFTTLQPNGAASPTIRNYFARLYNDPTTQFLTAPSASQITWQRGGAAPEISRVTFEQTVDGGSTWTAVGSASRVGATSNWQRTGLNLPMGAPLTLRATGETIGSQYNGSSGLVQAIGVVQPIPIEAWRIAHFGTSADSGFAANNADPDADGLCNLDEYALAGHPLRPANRPVPTFMSPAFLFSRNASATDISLRIETSATLGSGSWTPIATRTAGANGWSTEPGVSALENDSGFVTITDSVAPGVVPQQFLRLVVTHP